MCFQAELRQTLLKLLEKALGFGPTFKPDDQIIAIADDDHVSRMVWKFDLLGLTALLFLAVHEKAARLAVTHGGFRR